MPNATFLPFFFQSLLSLLFTFCTFLSKDLHLSLSSLRHQSVLPDGHTTDSLETHYSIAFPKSCSCILSNFWHHNHHPWNFEVRSSRGHHHLFSIHPKLISLLIQLTSIILMQLVDLTCWSGKLGQNGVNYWFICDGLDWVTWFLGRPFSAFIEWCQWPIAN